VSKALHSALKVSSEPLTLVDTETGASAKIDYDAKLNIDIRDYSPDLKTFLVRTDGPNTPEKCTC